MIDEIFTNVKLDTQKKLKTKYLHQNVFNINEVTIKNITRLLVITS